MAKYSFPQPRLDAVGAKRPWSRVEARAVVGGAGIIAGALSRRRWRKLYNTRLMSHETFNTASKMFFLS